jgi:predicted transcriptional regulator
METYHCQGEAQKDTIMRIYRKALDLSQKEFAKSIGIGRHTVIRCESGEREPQLTSVQWKRFCRLIKNELGVAVLLHFIDNDVVDLSSSNVAETDLVVEDALKSLHRKSCRL